MEGRVSGGGGCCIARYGHNNHHHHGPTTHPPGFYSPYDGSRFEHIMLRFRPIAPKPAVGEPNNKPTSPAHDGTRKGKRKNNTNNTRGRKKSRSPSDDGNNNNNRSKSSSCSPSNGCKVTLPLLPETPDLSPRKGYSRVGQSKTEPMWLCFGPSDEEDQTAVGVVGSSVTVEGVTDTWMDGNSLGCTNEERKRRLDEDTCPGFISDGWNRVCWTNKAYRRMVAGEEDTWVMVKLGMRDKVELPAVKLFPAFTCRVRVVYGKNNGTHHTMTVPCDAWGMDGGGFAWRLDVKAALSLGR